MAVLKAISEGVYPSPQRADEFTKKIIENLLVVDP